MKPIKNSWPNGVISNNISFSAQLLREMLSLESFSGFRVPTLDVIARLSELAYLTDSLIAKQINPATLEPSLQELHATIAVDEIVQYAIPLQLLVFSANFTKNPTDETAVVELRSCLIAMLKALRPSYRGDLETAICAIIDKPSVKISLSHLLSLYCSHMINMGYSRLYIAHTVETRFFSSDIKRIERRTLARFFKSFSGQDIKFRVLVPISKLFSSYLESMKVNIISLHKLLDLPSDLQQAVKNHKGFIETDHYAEYAVDSKDPYSAYATFREMLSALGSFNFLHRSGIAVNLGTCAFVRTMRGVTFTIVDLDGVAFQEDAQAVTKRMANDLKLTSRQVLTRFTPDSTDRLINALRTSALARATSSPESQLISLWSAVEVLLSDPKGGRARILHYVDLLIPAICARYTRRHIIATVDELRVHYRISLKKILSSFEFEGTPDDYTRFTHILLLDKYEAGRTDLCDMLKDNPLALFRLWKMRDMLGTYGELQNTLKNHENRVKWQLFRIYRVRNLLVHNGAVPTFLKPLVVNAFEYFRTAITTILSRTNNEEGRLDVDQVVYDTRIEYEGLMIMLNEKKGPHKNENIDEAAVKRFMR
jgi:hypothetical protein